MNVTLDPDQEAWLRTRVASGDFASLEEAARQLLAERIAELAEGEGDDMAWAKPYIDEAREDIARGAVIGLEEHRARMAARLAALKS